MINGCLLSQGVKLMAADQPVSLQQWLSNIPVQWDDSALSATAVYPGPLPRRRRISWADTSGSLLEEVRLVSPLPQSAYVPSPEGQVPPLTLPSLPALGDPSWQTILAVPTKQAPHARSGAALFRAVENFVNKNRRPEYVNVFSASVEAALQKENVQPAPPSFSQSFTARVSASAAVTDEARAIPRQLDDSPAGIVCSEALRLPLEQAKLSTSKKHSYFSLHKMRAAPSRPPVGSAAIASGATFSYSQLGRATVSPPVPFMPNRHSRWQGASTMDSLANATDKVLQAGRQNRATEVNMTLISRGDSSVLFKRKGGVSSTGSSSISAQQSSYSIKDTVNTAATVRRSLSLSIRPLTAHLPSQPFEKVNSNTAHKPSQDSLTPQATIKALLREGSSAVDLGPFSAENILDQMRMTPKLLEGEAKQTPKSKRFSSDLFAQVALDIDTSRNLNLKASTLLNTPSVNSSMHSAKATPDRNVTRVNEDAQGTAKAPEQLPLHLFAGNTAQRSAEKSSSLRAVHEPREDVASADGNGPPINTGGAAVIATWCETAGSHSFSAHPGSHSHETGTFLEDCVESTAWRAQRPIAALTAKPSPRAGTRKTYPTAVSASANGSMKSSPKKKPAVPASNTAALQRSKTPCTQHLQVSKHLGANTSQQRTSQRPPNIASLASQGSLTLANAAAAKRVLASLTASRGTHAFSARTSTVSKPSTLSSLIYAQMNSEAHTRMGRMASTATPSPQVASGRTSPRKAKTPPGARKPPFLVRKGLDTSIGKHRRAPSAVQSNQFMQPQQTRHMDTPKKLTSKPTDMPDDATLTPASRFVRKLVATVSKAKPTWK